MTGKNGNGIWQWVCGILATAIIAVTASWFSFGDSITRSEASQMIQTESPYVTDKSAIDVRLKNIEQMLTRIDRKLSQ